jgi:hypothetical protein
MKILFVSIHVHDKNSAALLQYNIITHVVQTLDHLSRIDFGSFDVVISPAIPIRAEMFPQTIFLFGPHFSVFPEASVDAIRAKNAIYIQPSEWAVNVWKQFPICQNLNLVPLPFGVDTETFCDINRSREKVFIYLKRRKNSELEYVKEFLEQRNIEYMLIQYGKYNQEDYLYLLRQARYGIWLGCHESQGFALEEALSCNVPLLVWNVSSMNQETGQRYLDYKATTIPYWNQSCGEFFYSANELEPTFEIFQQKLNRGEYQPRAFVVKELSMEVCKERLLSLIRQIKQTNESM